LRGSPAGSSTTVAPMTSGSVFECGWNQPLVELDADDHWYGGSAPAPP
jgi:hypothetical protein